MMSDETVVVKLFVDPYKRDKFILPFADANDTSIFEKNNINNYSFCDVSLNQPFNCGLLDQPSTKGKNTSTPEWTNSDEIKTINEDSYKFKSLLRPFSSSKEWPLHTNTLCHWCCHPFTSTPIGLPLKYCSKKNVFHVTNCFCSFNCAIAFNNTFDTYNKEEREHLLYYLLHKVRGISHVIKPAPSPLCLKAFGGELNIEEFRNTFDKLYFINAPPLVMIPQQIEEVSENTVSCKKEDFVPLDMERVNKYNDKLKLKREKPLHGNKTTLDSILNIKIVPSKSNKET